jgi:hypothetical protein
MKIYNFIFYKTIMEYQKYKTYEEFRDKLFIGYHYIQEVAGYHLRNDNLTIKIDDNISYTINRRRDDGFYKFLEKDVRKHWDVYINYFVEKS